MFLVLFILPHCHSSALYIEIVQDSHKEDHPLHHLCLFTPNETKASECDYGSHATSLPNVLFFLFVFAANCCEILLCS